MNKMLLLLPLLALVALAGCESKAGTATLGGAAGAAVGAGVYEYRGEQKMDELEERLQRGEITKEEYDIRRDQIQQDYFLQR